MNNKHAACLVLGLLGLTAAAAPVWAAGDVEAGQRKAYTCSGCHGIPGYTNVYPTYHVPKLAGQNAEYLVAALKAYAAGKRDHATMRAQAMALSERDMRDIAAYFESLGPNERQEAANAAE